MVGPGTGVAPFRGFLHERRATGATGANWLFFGEQHEASDFYYADEIEDWRGDGHLDRLSLAFSRDQAEKLYVQHRMVEQGADLWRWLDEGAHFYVCGDASRMAKDVDAALKDIVARHGGMNMDDAADYVAQMAQEKRYVRDVY
jgi:sulfite reductase (NADPH) flavoprotein alpha-component